MSAVTVLQTKFGDKGNCLTACLASVLGIGPKDITEVREKPLWWENMEAALRPHNRFPLWLGLNTVPQGLALGAVESQNLVGYLHSVVVLGGKIVWDPHPKQNSYDMPLAEGYIVLVPLVPLP